MITALMLSMAAPLSGDLHWLGAASSDTHSSLHTAARRYERPGHCDIWAVGVAHLGDTQYYDALEVLLSASDVVVFEAVMPEGAVPPSGSTDDERIASTTNSLRVLAGMAAGEPMPESVEALALAQRASHRPSVNVIRGLSNDAWGTPVAFVKNSDGVVVRSLGSDGRPGGDGAAADIDVRVPDEAGADGGTLQRELAEALRMEFQLHNLPYEDPHWVPGDMSAEEVQRRLVGDQVEGGSDQGLGGMLTGTSATGQFAVGLIRMLPAIDRVSGGRAIDGLRLMMIETLSNEQLLDQGLTIYGEQFEQVILHDRNDVALEYTFHHAAEASEDDAVAVLYGAAHLPGIDAGLRAKGWQPVETRWLPAISVDLEASALTPEDIQAIKGWTDMAGSMFGG